MMPELTVDKTIVNYDHFPDVCPLCHHALQPIYLLAKLTREPIIFDSSYLEIVFKYPRIQCSRLFIAIYVPSSVAAERRSGIRPFFEFLSAVPFTVKQPPFPEEIKELSPNFIEIFGQASAAEQYQLGQIAGVGYRKALEFLVKDYCIFKHPCEEEKIRSVFLGTCIETYVDDANIRDCAKLATWLGNDETHYVRRWEDKDIKDLEALINLTMAWIQTNLLTEKYRKEMKK
jgi:hypothetical protein